MDTLEHMGLPAVFFLARLGLGDYRTLNLAINKLANTFLREPELLFEKRLLSEVGRFQPTIVLVIQGSQVSPKTVAKMRSVTQAPIVCWCQDPLIALGRQGKLAYVLSDNMYSQDEDLAKSAVEAIVALARWVSTETRWLQRGDYSFDEKVPDAANPAAELDQTIVHRDAMATYRELMAQRPEIESAVARAIDLSRGRNGPELLRASLLLCDWPGSKTLAVLQTAKHGGQTAMVRRLQQPPASEHVDAFLLAASHGQLRTHFGTVFAHISEVPVLDALLRKSHWLKDSQLQLCMHQVTRGAWWGESELLEDISRRDSEQSAKIGDWLVASGAHDVVQDDRMERLRERASGSFTARLHLLRLASQRRKGTSVALIKGFLSDPDERLARLAAREMIRRRPPEFQNILLAPMATAKPSVRRVISRSLGHAGFEQFWDRFDQLDRATRSNAGRADRASTR